MKYFVLKGQADVLGFTHRKSLEPDTLQVGVIKAVCTGASRLVAMSGGGAALG